MKNTNIICKLSELFYKSAQNSIRCPRCGDKCMCQRCGLGGPGYPFKAMPEPKTTWREVMNVITELNPESFAGLVDVVKVVKKLMQNGASLKEAHNAIKQAYDVHLIELRPESG